MGERTPLLLRSAAASRAQQQQQQQDDEERSLISPTRVARRRQRVAPLPADEYGDPPPRHENIELFLQANNNINNNNNNPEINVHSIGNNSGSSRPRRSTAMLLGGLSRSIGSSLSWQLRQARTALQALRRRHNPNNNNSSSSNQEPGQKPHDITTVFVCKDNKNAPPSSRNIPHQQSVAAAAPNYDSRISTISRSHEDDENEGDDCSDDPVFLLRQQHRSQSCCTFGTRATDSVWLVAQDPVGCAVAVIVWMLFAYSAVTVWLLAHRSHLSAGSAALYCTAASLALAAHAKTALTDPGSVPVEAVPPPPPTAAAAASGNPSSADFHTVCAACRSYKPHRTHHCRICGRCIARMDHHCPWMNNCIGASNFKHFILFLVYTWTACVVALLHFGYNYFGCTDAGCEFSGLEIHLVRVMTVLCCATLLFVSTILSNVTYSFVTGEGTVDRLQRKRDWDRASVSSTAEPMRWRDIFGSASVGWWWLPVDPVFDSAQAAARVYGFAVSPNAVWREADPSSVVASLSSASTSSPLYPALGGAAHQHHHPQYKPQSENNNSYWSSSNNNRRRHYLDYDSITSLDV